MSKRKPLKIVQPGALTVRQVVERLGGNKAVAAMYNVTEPAVCNWKAWNRFPPKLHLRVLRDCAAKGISYDPSAEAA